MGAEVRFSHRTKATTRTTPATSGPTTSTEPHGWLEDSMRPKVMPRSPSAMAVIPTTSSRRATGLRDSATATTAMTNPTTATGTLTQKTEDQLKTESKRPPITGPRPKPSPEMAAHIPKAPALRSGGYVSVRMASVSADMNAPPAPCRARDPMRATSEVDRAQATEPSAKTTMPARKKRLRP